jgi:hypothetical protein
MHHNFLVPDIDTQNRFALLSHAINLVLSTTIHHPTLLSLLLDVSLAHGLLYESNTVLRALLFVALSPASTGASPPICHPAHSVFLLELRTRWLGDGFPDQAFCRIVVEVLHAVQSSEAWECKAVYKLAKDICGSDFLSFMELVGGCTNVALELDDSNRGKITAKRSKQQDNTRVAMRLWTRIRQWLDIACDHSITTEDPREWSLENSDAVYAFLELSLSCLHHDICSVDNADTIHVDLQGAIVCLATLWLSSPFILNSQTDSIINRLREITPRSSTYVTLVTKIFVKLSLDLGQSKLWSFAAILRLHDLLHLEASLWACALCHIELPTPEHLFRSSNKIREYRDHLIDLVDDAEHRCFGVGVPSPGSPHTPSGHAKVDDSGSTAGRLNCEWQWEATLRCWVRKDNGHPSFKKRRKIEHAEALSLSGSRSSCLRHSAGITVHTRDMRLPLQPSSSNFTSLLVDAFSQRTVLHDIREKKTQVGDLRRQRKSLSSPSLDSHNNEHQEVISLPSDDLLDLFICEASSSPPHN